MDFHKVKRFMTKISVKKFFFVLEKFAFRIKVRLPQDQKSMYLKGRLVVDAELGVYIHT